MAAASTLLEQRKAPVLRHPVLFGFLDSFVTWIAFVGIAIQFNVLTDSSVIPLLAISLSYLILGFGGLPLAVYLTLKFRKSSTEGVGDFVFGSALTTVCCALVSTAYVIFIGILYFVAFSR